MTEIIWRTAKNKKKWQRISASVTYLQATSPKTPLAGPPYRPHKPTGTLRGPVSWPTHFTNSASQPGSLTAAPTDDPTVDPRRWPTHASTDGALYTFTENTELSSQLNSAGLGEGTEP